MIITVCTLLSLLQLIQRFKLYILKQRKPTLVSWGNIDQTTRISATIRINYFFSMNFTHFFEIFPQQGLFHCNWPNGSKYSNTEKARLYRAFEATHVL